MCELLVGLGDVDVLGVADLGSGGLVVLVQPRESRPVCDGCGTSPWIKDHREVDLVDLPAFGKPVILRVVRTRWRCPSRDCDVGSWTIVHSEIAPAGHKLTTRAGRWVTEQVGLHARTVSEVASELDADWGTINAAVIIYGEALLDADSDRIGQVRALSLDETLFYRDGPWRIQNWSTQLVDARSGQLLDVLEGRTSSEPTRWLLGTRPEMASRDLLGCDGHVRPIQSHVRYGIAVGLPGHRPISCRQERQSAS